MRLHVVVRRDEDDYYVATVPELPDCHTQAKSLDDLMSSIKEAISLYLKTEGSSTVGNFVGVQVVEVETC
jgi:predicted RNase H-like HicB family nuclease